MVGGSYGPRPGRPATARPSSGAQGHWGRRHPQGVQQQLHQLAVGQRTPVLTRGVPSYRHDAQSRARG